MADEKQGVSQEATIKKTSEVEQEARAEQPVSQNGDRAEVTTSKLEPVEESPANVTADSPSAKRRISFRKLIPIVVLLLAAGILLGITGNWNRFVGRGSTQRTDDAFLRADITPLSTRVSGTVAQVAVTDYQHVRAGDLLVQLKDDDFKAQVAQDRKSVV